MLSRSATARTRFISIIFSLSFNSSTPSDEDLIDIFLAPTPPTAPPPMPVPNTEAKSDAPEIIDMVSSSSIFPANVLRIFIIIDAPFCHFNIGKLNSNSPSSSSFTYSSMFNKTEPNSLKTSFPSIIPLPRL